LGTLTPEERALYQRGQDVLRLSEVVDRAGATVQALFDEGHKDFRPACVDFHIAADNAVETAQLTARALEDDLKVHRETVGRAFESYPVLLLLPLDVLVCAQRGMQVAWDSVLRGVLAHEALPPVAFDVALAPPKSVDVSLEALGEQLTACVSGLATLHPPDVQRPNKYHFLRYDGHPSRDVPGDVHFRADGAPGVLSHR